jgi:hypothetical protein
MEIAMAGQRKGGVASIEPDGTIVATDACRTMMAELFEIDVTRITPAQIEPTARALRAALTRVVKAAS